MAPASIERIRGIRDEILRERAAGHYRRAAKLFRKLFVLAGFQKTVVNNLNKAAAEMFPEVSAAQALCAWADEGQVYEFAEAAEDWASDQWRDQDGYW